MEMFDLLLVGGILILLALVVWALLERKSIKEVLLEIRDLGKEWSK